MREIWKKYNSIFQAGIFITGFLSLLIACFIYARSEDKFEIDKAIETQKLYNKIDMRITILENKINDLQQDIKELKIEMKGMK